MLSRRDFGKQVSALVAARAIIPGGLMGQVQPAAEETASQFSVMMWALNKRGTFDENLERVAEAGYRHVELVGEFAKWSEEDWRRILTRMRALKITVDATSGVKLGFADPSGGDGLFGGAEGPSFRRCNDSGADRSFFCLGSEWKVQGREYSTQSRLRR